MKRNIYILSLEPINTRYTGQWYDFLPDLIKKQASENNIECNVINVPGEAVSGETTDGAFLNFADTNIWKNTQMNVIINKFRTGDINSGDVFVFPDAWHTGIIQLKYMSELLKIPVKIHSIWHAGSYDRWDFLGQLVHDKRWSYNIERALFYASDYNYFATRYHARLFRDVLGISIPDFNELLDKRKAIVTGLPFDYLKDVIQKPIDIPKENLILFPHRIATEKQVHIFRDLQKALPEYEFIVCQDTKLTKEEYHSLLYRAKIVFSANLQETLGIGQYEGALAGAFPLVPDRLSYEEMYTEMFKYTSDCTDAAEYNDYSRKYLVDKIKSIILHYDSLVPEIKLLVSNHLNPYFSGVEIANNIVHE